jgi:hypothetical protein
MKNCSAFLKQTTRRILSGASAIALAVAFTVSLSHPAYAGSVVAPAVPPSLEVEAGNTAFLEGHGFGTQNYVCLPSAAGFAWTLFTPEATLISDADKQITTHFFGPNPDPADSNTDPRVVADGTIRAAWQRSRDGSTVWAKLFADPSFDPNFVALGAIPWLLLEVVGRQDGPAGGDTLRPTTFIQRVNTSGGAALLTGCGQLADVGKKAFIPYTADYFFFEGPVDSDGH